MYLVDNLKLFETMSFGNMVFENDRQRSLSRAMKLKSFDSSLSGTIENRVIG